MSDKIIHIHAKCDAFEIWEQVPEKKAVQRLIKIRNNFKWWSNRGHPYDAGNLVVKTIVVNPELQFSQPVQKRA
jgi:hypothetical protein